MVLTTQLLFCSLLVAVPRVAGSHPGVTRVLPVEGGLTDFRVGPAQPPPSSSPGSLATPPPPPPLPQNSAPAPPREESGPAESPVRFPNNMEVDLGGPHVRGVASYPVWSNNAPGYIPRPAPQASNTVNGAVQGDPGIDNAVSASGNALRQAGEYIEGEFDTPTLIGGQMDNEVTFRDEHHPSILIKNPTFNSVAIGFIVYLILLTVLQNSMLNWSQKGALLTLGTTTQRVQREAVDRTTPISHPSVSTTPAARGADVDDRARVQPDPEEPEKPESVEENRAPVSVAAILNDDHSITDKSRMAGPRAYAPSLVQSDHITKIRSIQRP